LDTIYPLEKEAKCFLDFFSFLDPVEWDQSHISHWLAWATKAFSLPDLNVVLFSQLSGHSLCSMSRDMFVALVGKDKDDLFWTHFDILRTNKRAGMVEFFSNFFVRFCLFSLVFFSRSNGAQYFETLAFAQSSQ
jgi:hypothetical protein